jgi:hypothetical protein
LASFAYLGLKGKFFRIFMFLLRLELSKELDSIHIEKFKVFEGMRDVLLSQAEMTFGIKEA